MNKIYDEYTIVSSFYWYQLPQLLQLMPFLGITDYKFGLDSTFIRIGFNLYVKCYDAEAIRKIICKAEWWGWFKK